MRNLITELNKQEQMKVTEIEKLKQLVSRTDMSGNEKVEWLTDFIDKHVTEQLRLNYVRHRRELLICPTCKSEHTYIKNDDFRKCHCPACKTSWPNL